MSNNARPLIVGAGPVGLAAALLLARRGVATRIIDAATERMPWSRALVVNPRTLDLLRSTGVSDEILRLGLRIDGAVFHARGRVIARPSFDVLNHPYPHMTALSQAVTEELLEAKLNQAGGRVERGVGLVECEPLAGGGVRVKIADTIKSTDRVVSEQAVPWVFGADGAHSVTRHQLNIDFDGATMTTQFKLIDVPLDTPLDPHRAHVALTPRGFVFMIRVVTRDDALTDNSAGPKLWRLMGNVDDPRAHLPAGRVAGPAVWESQFRVAHRLARRFSVGDVYLAGDAAHLHSPVGGRGLNLGIEDAWVFAELALKNQLHRYADLRRSVDRAVVNRVRRMTTLAAGQSVFTRAARAFGLRVATRLSPLRAIGVRTVTGLDHEVRT